MSTYCCIAVVSLCISTCHGSFSKHEGSDTVCWIRTFTLFYIAYTSKHENIVVTHQTEERLLVIRLLSLQLCLEIRLVFGCVVKVRQHSQTKHMQRHKEHNAVNDGR